MRTAKQLPVNPGYWHGYEQALKWVLGPEAGNPLGSWGVYRDPEKEESYGVHGA